jgi:hypothetical protein
MGAVGKKRLGLIDGCSVKKSSTYMFNELGPVVKGQQPGPSLGSISAKDCFMIRFWNPKA